MPIRPNSPTKSCGLSADPRPNRLGISAATIRSGQQAGTATRTAGRGDDLGLAGRLPGYATTSCSGR